MEMDALGVDEVSWEGTETKVRIGSRRETWGGEGRGETVNREG